MKFNKSILQSIISFLFAFLLTFFFLALYAVAGLSFGVFNNKSVTRAIDESNYYNVVYVEISKSMEHMVINTGLPTSVLKDVITLERVYISGRNYIEAGLKGNTYEIKTDKLNKILTDNIDQYLKQQNLELTPKLEKGIKDTIASVETGYRSAIELKLIHDISSYETKFYGLVKITLPILIVLIGVLCYFLIRMQKYMHRGIRYIVCALMAATLITLAGALYLLFTGQYNSIDVSPDYYKSFITAYLRWDIKVFVYLGGIGLTSCVGLIYLVGYLKNNLVNK